MKTYTTPDARKYHDKEVDAFQRVGQCDTLVAFHGSFSQQLLYGGQTFNILLEYADGGTLEDFFQRDRQPTSPEDIIKFWEKLLDITKALHAIHQVEPRREGPEIFHGWHQDVKPKNILVFSQGDHIFDSKFKLADLGLSHFRESMDGRNIWDKDAQGTREYGAPELYRGNEYLETANLQVKQGADMWSLGCVFSEAVVWSVIGLLGLEEYRQARRAESEQIPDFKDPGCFHDEQQVLKCVRDTHERVKEQIRKGDFAAEEVLRLIKELLEKSPDARPTATITITRVHHIVSDAKEQVERLRSQTDSTSNTMPRTPKRGRPNSEEPPPLPNLTVEEVNDCVVRRQPLPNSAYLDSLGGRDFVFLIDDGHRMKKYWPQVKRVCRALTYTVKKLDDDGLEMHCMVEMKKIRSKKTSTLIEGLDKRDERLQNDVDINKCLNIIFDEYMKTMKQPKGLTTAFRSKSPKPMVLFVLTTGVWDSNDNAEGPIKSLIKQLDESGLPDKHVGIQFVQFGDIKEGTKKLERLDKLVRLEGLSRDIVNTEHCTGNVWKMLLGSTNNRIDGYDHCAM
ncbi:putative serine threonine protein kinase [Phaeomoniella chlamydospora]|uniref:Putative serine threonine protein kinase n=1 Tax=Phaeomoniella chlamydospora TaxID=158046 RepID=A0A0G2EKH2_PHACM|nr:putative serine threonine protein kinase [Phaeomoniella chlamydospora]